MRLNPIFVILGFICTSIYAIPLPAPPADSNAKEVTTAKALLSIEGNRDVVEGRVRALMKHALEAALEHHPAQNDHTRKMHLFNPWGKIEKDYLEPSYRFLLNVQPHEPHLQFAQLQEEISFTWVADLTLQDSKVYSDHGKGWIAMTREDIGNGVLKSETYKKNELYFEKTSKILGDWKFQSTSTKPEEEPAEKPAEKPPTQSQPGLPDRTRNSS
ncbi:hypothetical protein BDP27DRAFT_1361118 [Rhodocollybia butyracea]|uniref:Secreted protein n=1 Tax=Rhodocollybia butyracea TaxID=206335 RepID=A0A9P5Q299_9AGAR|nr:hypothetical protein BDP27DRAFT_1361118 [Rhodocollybia butyracea]